MRNGCQAGLAQQGLFVTCPGCPAPCHLPQSPSDSHWDQCWVLGQPELGLWGKGWLWGGGVQCPPSAEPPSQLGPMPLGTEVGRVRVQAGTGHWELVPDEAELPRERGREVREPMQELTVSPLVGGCFRTGSLSPFWGHRPFCKAHEGSGSPPQKDRHDTIHASAWLVCEPYAWHTLFPLSSFPKDFLES